jgi:heme-degrading monooxygenase HmoA
MLVRIVKMEFRMEEIDHFQRIFHKNKELIRAQPGCYELRLFQEKKGGQVFFTYSIWEGEQALENYRNSDLFKEVWRDTKKLFADKPAAWSCTERACL